MVSVGVAVSVSAVSTVGARVWRPTTGSVGVQCTVGAWARRGMNSERGVGGVL